MRQPAFLNPNTNQIEKVKENNSLIIAMNATQCLRITQ